MHPFNRLKQVIVYFFTQYVFVRYVLVGAANTTVCVCLMYLGDVCGLKYLAYTPCAWVIATVFSFFMNLRVTFRVHGTIAKRLFRFCCVNVLNLCIVELIEYYLIDVVLLNHVVAIASALSWSVVAGFILNHYFVYEPDKTGRT